MISDDEPEVESKKDDHRMRTMKMFEEEKQRVLNLDWVSLKQKEDLRKYTLEFRKIARTRGKCIYPSKRKGRDGIIALSEKLIDNGIPETKLKTLIRHEIAHACTPGEKHSKVWKAFCLKIGGDGKRLCKDKEIKKLIGYRIKVMCVNGHLLRKMHNRPSKKWLHKYRCSQCDGEFTTKEIQ